jgi:hypothetical protein
VKPRPSPGRPDGRPLARANERFSDAAHLFARVEGAARAEPTLGGIKRTDPLVRRHDLGQAVPLGDERRTMELLAGRALAGGTGIWLLGDPALLPGRRDPLHWPPCPADGVRPSSRRSRWRSVRPPIPSGLHPAAVRARSRAPLERASFHYARARGSPSRSAAANCCRAGGPAEPEGVSPVRPVRARVPRRGVRRWLMLARDTKRPLLASQQSATVWRDRSNPAR